MPDSAVSAVNSLPDSLPDDSTPSARSRRRRSDEADVSNIADTEKTLARAARSTQRLAQLSEAQRGCGQTLDLFAEDAERANQQAMNTDIRQGTFAGFELPDVFMAAVQSNAATRPRVLPKPEAEPETEAETPQQASFQDELLRDDDELAATPPSTPPDAMAAVALRSSKISANATPVAVKNLELPFEPELDRARVTAFADTIDALRAVLAEQRTSTAVHARRMKTLLSIIVGVMLLTVATGVAQTVVLIRMSEATTLRQQRMEQMMLNQEATLASLLDTDSDTFSVPNPPRDAQRGHRQYGSASR